MTGIPAYYLRKPYYYILQHASVCEDLQLNSNLKNQKFIEIKRFGEIEKELSPEELEFNKSNNLQFSNAYSIFRGHNTVKIAGNEIEEYWRTEVFKLVEEGKLSDAKEFLQTLIVTTVKGKLRYEVELPILNYTKKEKYPEYNRIKTFPHIEPRLAIAICNIAVLILEKGYIPNLNKDYILNEVSCLKQIRAIIVQKSKIVYDASDTIKNIFDQQRKFWMSSDSSIPNRFYNSTWVQYERTDGVTNTRDEWGILKSYVEIGSSTSQGYTAMTVDSIYGNVKYKHEGIITFETQSEHLIGHLTRIVSKSTNLATPSFYILYINDVDHQNLILGYLVYYSMFYKKYLTKTIVLQSTKDKIIPKEIGNSSAEFKNININIRRLLYNKERNQLTMPSSNISNLDEFDLHRSLQNWIKKRTEKILLDDIVKACVGKYYVCFFYGDIDKAKFDEKRIRATDSKNLNSYKSYTEKNIYTDELIITFNEDAVDFDALYVRTHGMWNFDQIASDSNFYTGNVKRKGFTIQIILEENKTKIGENNIKSGHRVIEADYLTLMFCVPKLYKGSFKEKFNQADYFEGIISGLDDDRGNPISYKVLLFRRSSEQESFYEEMIFIAKEYFQKNLEKTQIKIIN